MLAIAKAFVLGGGEAGKEALVPGHVVLFTHAGCPGGEAAQTYLRRAGVTVTVRDIGANGDARS